MKKTLLIFLVLFIISVSSASVLQEYNINEYKNMYQITVTFDELPAFREMTLESPFRIVVDFRDTVTEPPKRSIDIGRPPFDSLRIAQYNRDTARLVLEMSEKVLYTVSSKENTLIISISYANDRKVDTLDKYIDVKLAPRDDSVTLTRIRIGAKVKSVNEKDGWVLIILPDGQDGWIKKESIRY